MDILQDLWKPPHLESADAKCIDCEKRIAKDDTLARTFALQHKDTPYTATAERRQNVAAIQVPWMSETILLFDRHLQCLLSAKTKYVTVSHVWAPAVSKLQNDYVQALTFDKISEKEIDNVARLVLETPLRIYTGIVNSLKSGDRQEGRLEVWHDYLSVPQWCHERKGHIIQHIPELYSSAYFVVPYFYDLAPSSVQAMRKGPSTQKRVQGIFDVCNSRWFRRIWTAMEYVQSSQLRPMLQDYKLLDEFRPGFPLADEPEFHWREMRRYTSLEDITNFFPYYLGSPEPVRTLRLQRKVVPFAECFKLISRRQATVPVDFIHALIGLTEPLGRDEPVVKFSELPHNDLRKCVSIIAKARLRSGDFSPLFMMPRNRDDHGSEKFGFVEFGLFGLGMEEDSPDFPEVVLCGPGESRARFKAQNLGTVTMAKRFWRYMDLRWFNKLVKEVLDITGPDPDAFAETVWCRLFGEYLGIVRGHLDKENRRSLLQRHLELLYNGYPSEERYDITDNMAQLFMLKKRIKGNFSQPAMDFRSASNKTSADESIILK